MKITKLFDNLGNWLSKYWAFLLVGSNIFLIAIATLSPYTFIIGDHLTLVGLLGRLKYSVYSPLDIDDLTSNILLFTPLGLGLARIFQQRFSSKQLTLITSLIISLSLSLTVEALQIFLPKRTPSILDLLANILGGVMGAVTFCLWQSYFAPRLYGQLTVLSQTQDPCPPKFKYSKKLWLTKNRLLFMTLSYTSLIFCLMISLQRTNNFSNWDLSFPLMIGNEQTGDRPWKGQISQVYFANRPLSTVEVTQIFTREQSGDPTNPWITGYQLTGNGDYPDQNRISPALKWQEYSPPVLQVENQDTIPLAQKYWLSTPEPVTELIQSIGQTSRFSLLTTVATKDTQQTGPARIVSISADTLRRNLTIGQQGADLIVRQYFFLFLISFFLEFF